MCTAPATPAWSGSVSITSTSTTSTASTPTYPSRRRWGRWASWSRPARCVSSASPRRPPPPSGAPTAVQSEYSLFARDMEDEVLPTLRELGIGFVAYSPLGRGLLTGAVAGVESLAADDVRRQRFPQFAEENLDANMALVEKVRELAASRGATPAQLALAWVLHRGDDVVPIPGTKRRARVEENAAAVEIELSAEELAQLDAAVPRGAVQGQRHWNMAAVNG